TMTSGQERQSMKMILTAAVLLLGSAAFTEAGQETGNKTFDHYEAIRVALSTDTLKGVAGHASALAPLAGDVAGAAAKKAAEQLAAATDIKDARQHFATLSAAFLPAFEKAQLK